MAKSVYMLVQDKDGKMMVYQLTEWENNIKIENLLKKGMFKEAENIAKKAGFPKEIVAEICKEHADQLYN